MIATLVLDVDGVLIRGRPGDGRHWSADLEADLGLSPERLQTQFFKRYWSKIVTGRMPMRPCLVATLAEIAPELTAQELISYWFAHDSMLDEELLADLAGWRRQGLAVHLATNQEDERMAHLWDGIGLCHHADARHWSAAIGHAKPDPAFFHRVAAQIGQGSDSLLLIDDAAPNIAAARAAGWRAWRWTGQHRLSDVLEMAWRAIG